MPAIIVPPLLPPLPASAAESASRPDWRLLARLMLLAAGVASSFVYVMANIVASLSWPDYSSASQTISELSAIGAPSRATWLPLGYAYDMLLIAFAVGMWWSAGDRRGLRLAAILLLAIGLVGPVWPPMHLRGSVATLTDTLHVLFAGVVSLALLIAIAASSTGFGRRFRLYSIATVLVMLVFGTLTANDAPAVAANLATPWVGVYERIVIGSYLLWQAVVAVQLIRRSRWHT
jgi:uncharacterized protein DUF998